MNVIKETRNKPSNKENVREIKKNGPLGWDCAWAH